MAKKPMANRLTMFEKTMTAVRSQMNASSKKKTVKTANRKVNESVRRRKLHEEDDIDITVDDEEFPDDALDGVVVVVDPELDAEDMDDNLDQLQAIISGTPAGQQATTDEYIGDEVYTCPNCGNTFFSDEEMKEDEECPICGEVAVNGFILGGEVEDAEEDKEDIEDEEELDFEEEDEDEDDLSEEYEHDFDDDEFDDRKDYHDHDFDDDEDDDDDHEEKNKVDIDITVNSQEKESKKSRSARTRKVSSALRATKYSLDESTINPMLTKFIRENYKNAVSMTVQKAVLKGNKLRLECKIVMKSGKAKRTSLVAEGFTAKKSRMTLKCSGGSVFKVEGKTAPFIFEATLRNSVIKATAMKYNFVTKSEGKKVQVLGSYSLKENRKLREAEDIGPEDSALRELLLYIENDGQLYRQHTTPIIKNLARKKLKGTYDTDLAAKLYKYLADDGAKKYARDFANANEWNRIFSVAVRKKAAEELRDYYDDEVDYEVDKMKKAKK